MKFVCQIEIYVYVYYVHQLMKYLLNKYELVTIGTGDETRHSILGSNHPIKFAQNFEREPRENECSLQKLIESLLITKIVSSSQSD